MKNLSDFMKTKQIHRYLITYEVSTYLFRTSGHWIVEDTYKKLVST